MKTFKTLFLTIGLLLLLSVSVFADDPEVLVSKPTAAVGADGQLINLSNTTVTQITNSSTTLTPSAQNGGSWYWGTTR